MVHYLIEQKADINVRDNRGTTALYWAVVNNHTEIAKLLIDNGADAKTMDNRGWTPLDHAVAEHHEEVAKIVGTATH